MKKQIIHIILTIIVLIPATLFTFWSVFGLIHILSHFYIKEMPILVSIVFGQLGYIGLLMNLIQNKGIKAELLNFILLLLGTIGMVLFISFEGGIRAWKWIIEMKDPREWFPFIGLVLITLYLLFLKGKRLMVLRKHTD